MKLRIVLFLLELNKLNTGSRLKSATTKCDLILPTGPLIDILDIMSEPTSHTPVSAGSEVI